MLKLDIRHRLIAVILCFLICFPCFSAFALDYGTVLSNEELNNRMDFLGAVGIFDESYSEITPSYKVTRGEFAIAVSKIIANNLSFNDTEPSSYYSDMEGLGAEMVYAVNLLTDQGLVSGVGGGLFKPDDIITCEQAVKILICAMGYDILAANCGGYPLGYMSEAGRIGLLGGIDISSSAPLTWEAFIVMLYNSLFIDIMQTVNYGDQPQYSIVKGETVLTNVMNIGKLTNVRVTANHITSIDGNSYTNKGFVKIENTVYSDPAGYADALVGRKIDLYYKMNGSKPEVVYAVCNSEESLVIDLEDIENIEGYEITYYDETANKSKTVKLASDAYIICNSQLVAYQPSVIDTSKNGSIILECTGNSSDYDMIIASIYTDVVVAAVDYSRMTVYDAIKSGNVLEIKKYIDNNRCLIQKNGETTDIDGITEDSVLAVYNTPDDSFITISVLSSSLNGTIESLSDNEVVINNETYKFADSLKTIIQEKIGEAVTFYRNHDGKIIFVKEFDGDNLKYAYAVDAGISPDGLDASMIIRVLNENNDWNDFIIPDKLTVNGSRITENTKQKIMDLLYSGGSLVPQLIQYGLNDSGELSVLNTADFSTGDLTASKSSDDFYCSLAKTSSAIKYKSGKKSFGGKATINDSTKIFIVSPSGDTDKKSNSVKTPSYFSNDRSYTVAGYNMNEGGVLGALVCYASLSGNPSYNSKAILVDYVTDASDDEGNSVQCLRGLMNGSYVTYLTDGETQLTVGDRRLKRGDIVRVSFDVDSRICGVNVDVNVDTFSNESPSYESFWSSYWAISGAVYSKKGSYAIISNTNVADLAAIFDNPNPEEMYAVSLTGSVMIYDSQKDMIYAGSNDDILTYEFAGNSATRFFARFNYEALTDFFIFK